MANATLVKVKFALKRGKRGFRHFLEPRFTCPRNIRVHWTLVSKIDNNSAMFDTEVLASNFFCHEINVSSIRFRFVSSTNGGLKNSILMPCVNCINATASLKISLKLFEKIILFDRVQLFQLFAIIKGSFFRRIFNHHFVFHTKFRCIAVFIQRLAPLVPTHCAMELADRTLINLKRMTVLSSEQRPKMSGPHPPSTPSPNLGGSSKHCYDLEA